MKESNIQFKDLGEILDKYMGPVGTVDRDQYEFDLKLDILGEMIKQTRKQRNLTQEQLGELVGVRKSEISKLERNARNMTIGTVLKVFKAMKANVRFIIELDDNDLGIA